MISVDCSAVCIHVLDGKTQRSSETIETHASFVYLNSAFVFAALHIGQCPLCDDKKERRIILIVRKQQNLISVYALTLHCSPWRPSESWNECAAITGTILSFACAVLRQAAARTSIHGPMSLYISAFHAAGQLTGFAISLSDGSDSIISSVRMLTVTRRGTRLQI